MEGDRLGEKNKGAMGDPWKPDMKSECTERPPKMYANRLSEGKSIKKGKRKGKAGGGRLGTSRQFSPGKGKGQGKEGREGTRKSTERYYGILTNFFCPTPVRGITLKRVIARE